MAGIAAVPATAPTWVRRVGVVGVTAVAGEVVFFVLRVGAGIDLAVRTDATVDHVGPVAGAVLVVSLLGAAGGVGAGAKLGLAALHLTVAAVVIVGLPWAGRKAGR